MFIPVPMLFPVINPGPDAVDVTERPSAIVLFVIVTVSLWATVDTVNAPPTWLPVTRMFPEEDALPTHNPPPVSQSITSLLAEYDALSM